MELMVERGYERVTVQDILDRADVGRSTFYAHFRSKDDLLVVSGAEYLRSVIAEHAGDPVRMLFDLVDGYPEMFGTLVGRKSSAVVIRGAQQMVADVLSDSGMTEPHGTFVSWGLVGLLAAVVEGRITADEGYSVVSSSAGVRAAGTPS